MFNSKELAFKSFTSSKFGFRDRIKISCNQLRKLIPNISGFKTDMASLLETCVVWAQLINTDVPHEYLNNVIFSFV